MTRRVVITGLGVIAPNGNGVDEFCQALRKGKSGLRKIEEMEELKFGCHVAALPQGVDALAEAAFPDHLLVGMNQSHRLTALAAVECWRDAGLEVPDSDDDRVDWDAL